jgi:homoserine dehydrogenase
MKNKITIGLFGFGCVGQGLYHVIKNSSGFKAEIKKIVVKHHNKKRSVDAALISYDKNDILNDDSINTIVELIDDADEALNIVSDALKKGKAVVSANKKMIAKNLALLKKLQEAYGGILLYEAAVCGSIPIIRNLEEYFDNEPIHELKGIFNGTTNYILTKIIQEQLSYPIALKQAQDLGFAESDPKNDVEGFDPTFKACIVAAHAFGVFIQPDQIVRQGITSLQAIDLQFAKQNNYYIKLQPKLSLNAKQQLYITVLPQFLNSDDALAKIDNEFNSVVIEGEFSGTQQFIGRGAGGNPTGAAVLSDLSALSSNYKYAYNKVNQKLNIQFSNNAITKVYLRLENNAGNGIELNWINMEANYSDNFDNYTIGYLSLTTLQSVLNKFGDKVFVALLPDSKFESKAILKKEKLKVAETIV